MRRIIFAAIFVLLVLIACAEQNSQLPQRQVPQPNAPAQTAQEGNAATVEPDVNNRDPDVAKLFERNSQVKSYSFDMVALPSAVSTRTYYVKGDKARVEQVEPLFVGRDRIDVIFLDLSAGSARGYCNGNVGGCPDPNKAINLQYEDYAIIMPAEWIEQIKYGQKIGSIMFGNKQVTRVAYEADGKYYEAYVDNFFGMPQRVAISSNPEMTQIVGGYEYRNMAFNTLQDSQVMK